MNGSRNKATPLLSSSCDLSGIEFSRVARLLMLNRLLPLGNLAGSGGLRCLLMLGILHMIGRPVFRVLIRYEQHLHAFYMILKKRRK